MSSLGTCHASSTRRFKIIKNNVHRVYVKMAACINTDQERLNYIKKHVDNLVKRSRRSYNAKDRADMIIALAKQINLNVVIVIDETYDNPTYDVALLK